MTEHEERDALAQVIEAGWGNPTWDGESLRPIDRTLADAILAAGYTKPRTVATGAEVEALAQSNWRFQNAFTPQGWADVPGWLQNAYRDEATAGLAAVFTSQSSPPSAHSSPVDASGVESDTTGATEATTATGDDRGNG